MQYIADIKAGDFSTRVLAGLRTLEASGYRYLYLQERTDDEAGDANPGHEVENIGSEPVLLAFAPLGNMNKYQALLYSNAERHGMFTVPLVSHEQIRQVPWPGRLIFHLHWIGNLVGRSASVADAEDRIGAFLNLIDEARGSRGARFVWSAHNILPHGSKYPDLDETLRKEIIQRCDAIHLLSSTTLGPLQERFDADESKTFVALHPTYEGTYPDFISRTQARIELGIDPDAFVFLFFGSLQGYKGIDQLCSAFEAAAKLSKKKIFLLIAGNPTDEGVVREAQIWAHGRRDALIDAVKIPDDRVQHYFRSADATVLPYRESLNSGVLFLSLTFQIPVIAPQMGALADLSGRGVIPFNSDVDGALAEKMVAVVASPAADRDGRAGDLTEYLPENISDEFFKNLMMKLSWTRG